MSDQSVINNALREQHRSIQEDSRRAALLPTRPWLRHYEQGVPAEVEVPDRPLTWLLDRTASRYPSHTAILYYGTRLTYAQLSSYANRFAIALQRLGVQKGDRVALALPNVPQYPIAFYGALKAGAVVVPTNPLYTEREMQHQLHDAGTRVVVMLDTFYPLVRAVRKQTAIEHVIITSAADFLPPVLQRLYPLSQMREKHPEPHLTDKELHEDKTLHVMHAILESHTRGGVELFNLPVPATANDLAVLQYTGGTTGLAKGAMLTHKNLLSNAFQTRYWTPRAREGMEITLCVAPFFHSYGLTVGMNLSILAAATMVLLPRFQVKDVVDTIRKYHPTMFPGIPTMYLAILREVGKHSDYLGSIKFCISGAAPLPAKIQADFEQVTGGKLVEGYGLSEASPVTHCNPLTDECINGSIGLPLPNVEAAIINAETGEPVPVGEVGEIVVKGPNIMQGYWNREEETKAIFRGIAPYSEGQRATALADAQARGKEDGWMHTGDLGRMDSEGYFYVVERAKDLILASGFNVYPREVEEVLFQHPAVSEAAVAGTPDEYRGETVAAFIVLKPGFPVDEKTKQSILAFCKQNLTPYKVPKIIEFRSSLPKSLIGKVLRRELHVTT